MLQKHVRDSLQANKTKLSRVRELASNTGNTTHTPHPTESARGGLMPISLCFAEKLLRPSIEQLRALKTPPKQQVWPATTPKHGGYCRCRS